MFVILKNNMNKEIYKQQLIEKIIEKRQDLKHRKGRLEENMLAGICNKSILAQRKVIFMLKVQIHHLEYKIQHDIIYKLQRKRILFVPPIHLACI